MLCDNLEGWGGVGGTFKRQGIYVYLWLIHIVWQKPTQRCKAVILQLKKIINLYQGLTPRPTKQNFGSGLFFFFFFYWNGLFFKFSQCVFRVGNIGQEQLCSHPVTWGSFQTLMLGS